MSLYTIAGFGIITTLALALTHLKPVHNVLLRWTDWLERPARATCPHHGARPVPSPPTTGSQPQVGDGQAHTAGPARVRTIQFIDGVSLGWTE